MILDFQELHDTDRPHLEPVPESAVRFRMPPTRTNRNRWCWWDGTGIDACEQSGRLCIGQRRGGRWSGEDLELYTVEEQPAVAVGRVFLLLKISDGEVYETFLGHGGAFRCTCPGMQAGGHLCRHVVAVRLVVARPESEIVRPEVTLWD